MSELEGSRHEKVAQRLQNEGLVRAETVGDDEIVGREFVD